MADPVSVEVLVALVLLGASVDDPASLRCWWRWSCRGRRWPARSRRRCWWRAGLAGGVGGRPASVECW